MPKMFIGTKQDDSHTGSEVVMLGRRGDDILTTDTPWPVVILGGRGKDTLSGSDGNDILKGGRGADDLFGGAGADFLVGGRGKDTFHFDFKDIGGPADTIKDFKPGKDVIRFDGVGDLSISADLFVLGTEAKDDDDMVIYDQSTGRLYLDQDGVGGADQVLVAILKNKPVIDNYDIHFPVVGG